MNKTGEIYNFILDSESQNCYLGKIVIKFFFSFKVKHTVNSKILFYFYDDYIIGIKYIVTLKEIWLKL